MKFLVDAQLPRRLAWKLREAGYDTLHTLDLPDGNKTQDEEINRLSEQEKRIVLTKDADFVNSFLVRKTPYKLLLVSTGNISNRELDEIFIKNLSAIVSAFTVYNYVELTKTALIEHS
jgi:predicted nuclease of predicted toxin-antitoxin system